MENIITAFNTCDTHYVEIKNVDDLRDVLRNMLSDIKRVFNPSDPVIQRYRIVFLIVKNRKEFVDQIVELSCKEYDKSTKWCCRFARPCLAFEELKKIG